MNKVKLILAGIGIVLVMIIVLQNTEHVETHFLFLSLSMPRAILLFVTFLAGLLIGFLGATISAKRAKAAKLA